MGDKELVSRFSSKEPHSMVLSPLTHVGRDLAVFLLAVSPMLMPCPVQKQVDHVLTW